MLRSLYQAVVILAVIAGGTLTLIWFHQRSDTQRQMERLAAQKQELEQVVARLGSEKRVADVIVSKQEKVGGVLNTTLLFVEYDRAGKPLPAKRLVVRGSMIHFDAMVIKFERDFVQRNDPLRGHSLALFTRVYGEHETPENAARVDEPDGIPAVYRDADPRVTEFEMALWKDFWRLANDADFRSGFGVRVANGQGVWGPLEPERLYTLTLESSGGLNLTSEPMKGIYREALRKQTDNAEPARAAARVE
jgi:hypothetical protein